MHLEFTINIQMTIPKLIVKFAAVIPYVHSFYVDEYSTWTGIGF